MARVPALQRNPKSHLYRAAVNLSLDILKAQRRRPVLIEEPDEDVSSTRQVQDVLSELLIIKVHGTHGFRYEHALTIGNECTRRAE